MFAGHRACVAVPRGRSHAPGACCPTFLPVICESEFLGAVKKSTSVVLQTGWKTNSSGGTIEAHIGSGRVVTKERRLICFKSFNTLVRNDYKTIGRSDSQSAGSTIIVRLNHRTLLGLEPKSAEQRSVPAFNPVAARKQRQQQQQQIGWNREERNGPHGELVVVVVVLLQLGRLAAMVRDGLGLGLMEHLNIGTVEYLVGIE